MDKKEFENALNRVAELERTIRELKQENSKLKYEVDEYKKKEQSISSAIIASMEHANQLEASRKKLYLLDIQRSRLMYLRMEQIINELYRRYPELQKDPKLKNMSDKFKSMVFNDLNEKTQDRVLLDVKKQQSVDDPIKKLLRNIIDCFETKKIEEPIPATNIQPDILNTNTKSGFDFNEALHPTMELSEIMKAFNLTDNKGDSK